MIAVLICDVRTPRCFACCPGNLCVCVRRRMHMCVCVCVRVWKYARRDYAPHTHTRDQEEEAKGTHPRARTWIVDKSDTHTTTTTTATTGDRASRQQHTRGASQCPRSKDTKAGMCVPQWGCWT